MSERSTPLDRGPAADGRITRRALLAAGAGVGGAIAAAGCTASSEDRDENGCRIVVDERTSVAIETTFYVRSSEYIHLDIEHHSGWWTAIRVYDPEGRSIYSDGIDDEHRGRIDSADEDVDTISENSEGVWTVEFLPHDDNRDTEGSLTIRACPADASPHPDDPEEDVPFEEMLGLEDDEDENDSDSEES